MFSSTIKYAVWDHLASRLGKCFAAFSILAIQAGFSPLFAQQQADDTDSIDEIVVTAPNYVSTGGRSANKSDIPLVETPQSVTVISRDMIDLLNVNSLNESMRYVSGAIGESFGPDERYDWLKVRAFDPVLFIDGVQAPIASVNNTGADLYGSESVEILKGPASALYGQAPPGGIVNMTSRRPETEFGGELEAQLGQYDHVQLNGDITGAISDRVSGRMTALYRDRETQVDFLTSKRLFIAPAITFDISDDTSLTLLANYQDDDLDNYSTGFLPSQGTFLPNPLGVVPVGRNLGETGVNYFDRSQYSIGYDFTHTINDTITIQQNVKFFDVEVRSRAIYGGGLVDADFDGTPDDYRTVNRWDFPFNEDIESTNVDTRANLNFATGNFEHSMLIGVDYRHYKGYSEYGFAAAPAIDLFDPVYGAPVGDGAAAFPFVDATRDQTGIYIQDQIRGDHLIVTLTGRQDYLDTDSFGSKTDENESSYRAGVNYVFDNGLSPYIQTARSFQPLAGADADGNLFVPTTGTQVEAGIKYDGRELRSGIDLFASFALYKVAQQNLTTPDPENPNFNIQTGEVEVQGVEMEAAARIDERWSFNLAYTYTDTEVTKSNTANLGKELVAVPDTLLSALVDYTFQNGPLAGLGLGLGARYRGKQFGDTANAWQSDDVTVWDAIIRYDTKNWRVSLNASNLTDKKFVDRCSHAGSCFYGTRQLITVGVLKKFGQ